MTETIKLTIPGEPVPKLRARIVRRRGRSSGITPERSKTWEESAKAHLSFQLRRHPCWRGPVVMSVVFVMTRPKSVKRKYPSVKPDSDNLGKAVKDALNGILWVDDGQVIDCSFSKRYCEPGEHPGCYIEARQLCSAEENESRKRHLGVVSE